MVYERYIKKGGKIYGPYLYSSKKENGKVISQYISKGGSVKKKFPWRNLLILIFIGVLFSIYWKNFCRYKNKISRRRVTGRNFEI